MAKKMGDTSEDKATKIEGSAFSSQPVGYLLGKFGLLVVLAGLLLAAWYGQVMIVIVLGLLLSAAGLSRLWSRYSLVGVSCERLLNERRVFPGESVELRLRLVNRKLLPLPWIQLDDEIPAGFAPDTSLTPSNKPGYGLLSKAAALLWYTGVSWKERLYCHKRGYYPLGPITVTSGDIFGFYPRSVTESSLDHVIVYPKVFPIAHLGIPSLYPLGETVAERRLFEDPLRVIGVRDYNPRDSLRRIHWKASARRQELQVKVFEPTTTLKVAIFLAIDSFQHGGARNEENLELVISSNAYVDSFQQDAPHDEEDFELGISTAASIANHLMEQRSSVGLFINSCLADSGQPVMLLPGSSTGQLVEILEALAKVTPLSSSPFEQFLQAERVRLPWGTTLVFILSRPPQSLTELLVSLKESGHKMLVLQVGEPEESRIEHCIAWHHIRQPGDFMTISSEETK
jgi:uncharacterized protein (DUF58 family)